MFRGEFFLDLYSAIFPHDNTVLAKPSLPTLTEFFNTLSLAWQIVRHQFLAVDVDIHLTQFKSAFKNLIDCFELILPSVS